MAQEEKDKMRAVYFVPILFILAFAWGFGMLLFQSSVDIAPPPYLQEEPGTDTRVLTTATPWINVLVIIAIVGTGGTVFTLLVVKYKKLARYVLAAFIGLFSFAVSAFYLDLVFIEFLYQYSFLKEWMFLWALPIPWVVLTSYTVLRKYNSFTALVVLTSLGAGAGANFVGAMPFWTFVVLLPAVSIFDIVMVSRGYLKYLARTVDEEPSLLNGFLVRYGGRTIGLGDIFFYSTLVAFALLHFGIYPAVWASCGILIGWYILMLLIVKKKGTWAGLPAPLLLGGGLLFLGTLF